MKNKFNFLVKLICLISILISVSFFIVFVMNFEETKVKLASAGKINSETASVKPAIYEVVLEDETSEDMEINSDQEISDVIIEDESTKNYSEVELNNENCEYSIDSENNTVNIDEYNVSVDCIVIPSEIDGKKVDKINTEDFSDCYNLETIKISKEVSSQIEEIPNFQINEELEEENYVVYTTTREYGEAYKGYLELSEEERAKVNIIPPKYEKPLEIYVQGGIKELQPVGAVTDNSSYDLRDDVYIKVENQNPYGICYAYSSFTAAETFWSLTNNETVDFSEVHGAILTTGNGGQTFIQTTAYYANKLGPVYEEEYPVFDVRSGTLKNATSIEACIESTSPSSYSSIQNAAKTKIPVKYVTGTRQFGTITQAIKQDPSYELALANERAQIKEHIKTYGALAAIVNSNAIVEYNGKLVANDQTSSGVNHGVTVIGWDDNFDVSNFPSAYRPSENGAYLVLNSWGSDWGDDGCYWVSYEDKWVEYYLIGVTAMSEASENLQTSSMVVTDQQTGAVLDNGNIKDGTKIKMEVDVTVTTPISGETIEVSLRDNTTDYTSYMTVTGTELVNNKANIEMLVDTEELKGDQYVLEINYGTETVSKMIETPKDFSYSVNTDGTITMIAYTGSDKEVVIPAEYDGYTVSTVGKDTFMSCEEVEKITIEKGITTIEDYAFRGCEAVKEIIIPRTVTTIGTAPFIGCSNLEQLIIPRSVKTLGQGLVQYCTNLKELVIFKETTSIGSYMFYPSQSATIYCESGSTAESYASNNSYTYSIITSSYNITYNKNAGTDTVSNMPSTQNKVKYDTISMSSNIPTRSGYEFLGWATSSSATEPEYQPGDDYRTDANLSLYAVWETTEKEISYTVEYYKDGVKSDTDIIKETVPVTQSTITIDRTKINTEDKYLGYSFEKTEPAVLPSTVNNGDVIKVYYTVQNYDISYDLDGGEVIEGENPNTYTVNDLVSLINPVKEGYTFIGWTGSNGTTPDMSLVIEIGTTGNKTYKANYTINSYKLQINYYDEHRNTICPGYSENVEYGSEYSVTSPEIEGYLPDISVVEGIMGANDLSIDVIYSSHITTFKVKHYKQNIEDNDYTLFETEDCEGIVGSEASILPKEYPGFTFSSHTQEDVNADGNTVVSAYYDRNTYTVKYIVDGKQYGEVEEYRYEQEITEKEYPSKLGYNFSGWSEVPETMPANNVEVTGTFIKDETQTKELTYTIEYYKDNVKQDSDTEVQKVTVHVSESDTITIDEEEINTTNKYLGYAFDRTDPAEIPTTVENGTVIKVYYKLENYTITYDLNGGSLPEGKTNPESYTVNDSFVLEVPEKEGHTFTGWTGSNGESPEKTITIAKGTTGNKTYKANFDINTYTVTYKVDGEQYGEVESYEYGEAITPREEPSKTGYKFSGWGEIPETMPARNIELSGMFYLDGTQVKELSYTVEYYKDNVKQPNDTDTQRTIVQVLESDEITVDKTKINTEDKYLGYNFEKTEPAVLPEKVATGTVIKVYYTVQNYDISYDLDGGSLPEGKTNPESYTVNDSFVLEAPEKEGYTFTGWTGSNGETPEETVTIEKGTIGNKEYKANYSINYYELVIIYKTPGQMEMGPRIYSKEYAYGESYYVECLKVSGYTPSMSVVEGVMGAEDITIVIEYTPNTNTKYVVEHYKQNILDNNYTLADTEEEAGTTDTLTAAIAKEYLGFTAQKITQENINGDGSTIVRIYYDRNVYIVNYYVRLSEAEEYWCVDSAEYRFEETVHPLEYPESYGRVFGGWSEIPGIMPANNVDVYGTFNIDETQTKELKYTVEYYKNGVKQDADTEVEKTTVQVLEPDEITVDKSKINLEDKYVGYEFYITNYSEIPEKVTNGTVIKIYYIPIVYTITYDLDGGYLNENNPETYTIENEVTLNNPEKEGHTFIGWTGSNGEEPETLVTIEKGTTGNKEYKANFDINTYTLTYKVDGEVYGEIESYEYGESITPRENPTKRGYIFSGWSEIPETMPANDVEVTGTFTIDESQSKVLSYTVEYYKNNVKQEDDTEIEEIRVLEFEPDEMVVNKEKINTKDKYVGYTFEKTEPEVLPEQVTTGTVIKVYYTANTDIKYTVEHYKQNILDNNYTLADIEEKTGITDTLTTAIAKEYLGFTVEEVIQENIEGDGSTVVRIYYDRNVYTLTYIVDGEPDGEPEEYRFEEVIVPKGHPTKLGYKFSGWSEVPETMPANNIETIGTFIFDETQTKTLSYTVEYYKDGVKQDADTDVEEVTVHVLESDEMTVDKEKINTEDKYAGCVLDSTLTQIPDTVTNGYIIKVYYNRKDARINVEYRDFVTGEEISEKVIKEAKVFDTYDISEDRKEIDGYTFIEGPEEVTGEYTEEEQTKVYKYAKNSKVTVNYIEKSTGNQIAESVVIDGYETKDYETEEKVVENYVLIETTNNTSGKMTREEIIVNYYYIYVSEGVVERHLDVITNEVLDTKLYEGNEGDSYKTEPKEFEGYDLVEDRMPTNAEGIMTKDAIIVEYFYIRNTSVKVQYVDKMSNEILDEEVIYGNQNESYKTEAKEFEGYRLVERPKNAEGTMTVTKDEDQNIITETIVTYYYKKVSEGVIEKHIDIKTNEVLEEITHSGLEGDSYKIEAKEFEGYDLVEDRMPTNAEGKMTKEKIEVNYYYIRKTTVRVEYIDVITNEKIVEDVVINNHEGDQYKVERKEFEQYIIVEDRLPENEEGTMVVTKEDDSKIITEIVVKYYYIRKATVKVEYIDKETGEKISEDTIIDGKEGESYKAEPKEIKGYNLLEETENAEGTMTKEEIIVKFYYEKKVDSEEYLIKENEIKKIVVGTTISDLKENLATEENYVILDQDGKEVSGKEVIKTGMKLRLEDGKEYDLVVRGDLNCDGKVTLTDLSKLILHYNGNKGFILSGSPCEAADMNYDDKITLTDVSQMVVFYNSI